jgi:SAM-dependent methyltransferase
MLVGQYFAATVPSWEEIYRRPTVYSTIYQERLQTALRLVDTLALARPCQALDIGCGPGFGTVGLASRGLSVHSVDVVSEMVDITLRRARGEGVQARVRGAVSDIASLPFADGVYDLAFVIGVSEWLETLDPALSEVARVLKPGAHLVLSADNSWALASLLEPLQHPLVVPVKRALGRASRRIWPRRRLPRTRAYSMRELDAALQRAGLRIVRSLTVGFGPFSFFNWTLSEPLGLSLHRRLERLADRGMPLVRDAGLTHVILAQKSRTNV